MFQKLLLAVDGSPGSDKAIEVAGEMAKPACGHLGSSRIVYAEKQHGRLVWMVAVHERSPFV